MLTNPIECVVCGQSHVSESRMGQYNVIACDKVTPTGNVMFFPKKFQVVVGAGMWVSDAPVKELTVDQLQAAVASLENAKAAGVTRPGPSVDGLKKRLAELQAG